MMMASARTQKTSNVKQTILSAARKFHLKPLTRCLAVLVALAAAAATADETAAGEFSFVLQPVSDAFSLPVKIDLDEHEVHFKKMPAFLEPPTCGAIPLNERATEFVGFAWDKSARRVYVDANRNLDLTDDQGSTYDSGAEDGVFKNVRFSVEHGELNIPYVVDLRLSEPWLCMAVVTSGWKGSAVVNGVPCEIALADNLDGNLTYEDSFTVKQSSDRAAAKPEAPDYVRLFFSDRDHGLPKYLALGGRTLAVHAQFAPAVGGIAVDFRLTAPSTPMGEIKLAGQNIEEMVLLHDGPLYAYPSGGAIAAPVGRYEVNDVVMAGGWRMDDGLEKPFVTVELATPFELHVGGPLSQKVEVTRSGNTLLLTHAVQGIGKEGYSNSKRYESPPEFTVYRGDTAVAADTFEYG